MKSYLIVSAALTCVLVCGCRSPNITGNWKGSWQSADSSHTECISLELTQANGHVIGFGEDEHGSSCVVAGCLMGRAISLTISNDDGCGNFAGLVRKGTIDGTWSVGDETGPWSITREKSQNKAGGR